MDRFFVNYLESITNNLPSSLYLDKYSLEEILDTFFWISIKNCTSIEKIGGDHLFY